MSFKYRFILSFVLLEIIFIILIVTVNFLAINNSSNKLINQNVESNIKFLEELLKVPVAIYDLATLDDLAENTQSLPYINSIIILDSQDKVLSSKYNYKDVNLEELILNKKDSILNKNKESFIIKYKEIMENDNRIGSFYLIFDTTNNSQFIKRTKTNTIAIVLIEIIISTILSYIIGSRLTNMLTNLSSIAKRIGDGKAESTNIPYQDKKDEIGILSSSMNQMKTDLVERRKRLENLAVELNKQKNQLLEANKHKDVFLANMSHELKTPLNSINVISSVMIKNKKENLDQQDVKNLNIINSCGKDLLYLINDVLDISKLEAGELLLDEKSFNFKEFCFSIKDMIEPQIEAKNLEFIFSYDDSIKYIYSDDIRIKQIIKNLLSNSLKFVESGQIRFIVKDLNEQIKIEISDDGIGIEESKLEHIFDRFKQVDGGTSRKYGGTGLGLAICKELSVLLNGKLTVKSVIEQGTTFTLIIPKNLNKVDVIEEEEIEEQKIDFSNNESNSILLLNNDPINFMKLSINLNKKYDLHQVNSIEKVEEKILDQSFKLIILDITKENLNDIENLISKTTTKFAFIYENKLSSKLDEISLIKIKKPFDNEEFINLINTKLS